MKRRDFITALAASTAWMSVARAQKSQHIVGFLSAFSAEAPIHVGALAAVYQGLKEVGFVEGHNVNIESKAVRLPCGQPEGRRCGPA